MSVKSPFTTSLAPGAVPMNILYPFTPDPLSVDLFQRQVGASIVVGVRVTGAPGIVGASLSFPDPGVPAEPATVAESLKTDVETELSCPRSSTAVT